MSLNIIGTGVGLPKKKITNDALPSWLDTNDEWIYSRTGIKSRYLCIEESLTDLCEMAAIAAMAEAKIEKSEIDMILCSTISGDTVTPSLACLVSERLHISCPAFDVNAACSGFIYALDIVDSYFKAGKVENILIISGEMMSKHVDWKDRTTCVLFGDGAGAAVVTKGNGLQYIHLTAKGDSSMLHVKTGRGNHPYIEEEKPQFLHMDGQGVFKFAVSMVEREAKLALKTLDITADDIDFFLLHQANKRIIDFARNKLKQSEEKFPMNIENYGNVSSSSIPILLNEMSKAERIKKGNMLLLSSFGAGLTTGTCVIKWE